MIQSLRILFLFIFITINVAYSYSKNFDEDTTALHYTLFLIGDTGYPKLDGKDPNLNLLKEKLLDAGEKSGVIFLGDNIYPSGLHPVGHPQREESEQIILEQLKILEDYPGDIFFIAGNHDWKKGRRGGLEYVLRQEQFINSFFENRTAFFPGGGCPGPVEIELTDKITLVLLDTQWMLHAFEKPERRSYCEYGTIEGVMEGLEDILTKNSEKHIIVAGHHPIYTFGSHAGVAGLKQHLFPLTDAAKNVYMPLPFIGSIYPLYRKYLGHTQDINHPLYKSIRESISEVLRKFPGLIYAAGHDHNLQYIYQDSVNYIISGSGSKISLVRKKRGTEFAANKYGFAELKYFESGKIELKFWGTDTKDTLYTSTWVTKPLIQQDSLIYYENIDFSDSTTLAIGSTRYHINEFNKSLLGENYRQAWITPIEVPFFDMSGYSILKKSGGQSTISLRIKDEEGKEYVLRSIDKDPELALPENLRGTLVADIFHDQISANHPYGALVIPKLASAAGIYHLNPKLVVIPDDPRLGRYREQFKNMLVLFEERPDDQWEGYESFGNPDDIDSYNTVIENVIDDHDVQVDQLFVVRNRLFDIIVGDWDRHDDQWRWAQFNKDNDSRIYRPIARDRDQVFFKSDGILTGVISKVLPKFQGFNPQIDDIEGFNFNARFFDRFFMTEPSAKDWLDIAEDLQNKLSNEVIEEAVRSWPEKIFKLNGRMIIETLKARRDNLKEYALDYYLYLSEKVNVLGSNKRERFEVNRLSDNETLVTVYNLDKDGEIVQKSYERLFKTGQTKEVRLYGFDGSDEFIVVGNVNKSVKVRIIGGDDKDVIIDESRVGGLCKNTIVYDEKDEENILEQSSETKNKISNRAKVNEYNREEFKENKFFLLPLTDYNSEDGIFLGAGAYIVKQGFRKYPFASRHLISAKYALATGSWDNDLRSEFIDALGSNDLLINADIRLPWYTNYFGLGNETTNLSAKDNDEVERSFYQVRLKNIRTNIMLRRNVGEVGRFYFGPSYSFYELERQQDKVRFINNLYENNQGDEFAFTDYHYGGGIVNFTVDTRNNPYFTTSGVFYYVNAEFLKGLNSFSSDQAKFTTEFSMYLTFPISLPITLANRTGGAINFGDYEFFHGSTLGETTNLRGFRKNRFTGRKSFFNNTEVRVTLSNLKSFILPGPIGVLGFYDVGRVWIDNENSKVWHKGYGAGIWYAPLNRILGSLSAGFSSEEAFQFNIDLSYNF